MSSGLYDVILILEALFLIFLTIFLLIFYVQKNQGKFVRNQSMRALFLAVLLGWLLGAFILVASWWPYDPLLCLALVFSLGLLFIHDSLLLSLFIFLLFLRPWELAAFAPVKFEVENLVSIPKVWIIILGVGCLLRWKKIKEFSWCTLDTLVISFMVWMAVPLLIVNNQSDFKLYEDTLLRSGLIYFLIRWCINDQFGFQVVTKTISFIGLFLVLTSLLQYFYTRGTILEANRVEAFGLFQNSNDLGALIVFACPFSLKMMESKSKWLKYFLQSVFVGSVLLAIYVTQSRGAFLGLLVVFMVYFGQILQLKKISWPKLIMGVGFLLLIYKLYSNSLGRSDGDIHASSWGRINYWVAAIRMAIHNPLWGVGFGQYPLNFERYTLEFLESGQRTAHSSFFLVLGEGGLLGFILFVSLFKVAFSYMSRFRQQRIDIVSAFLGYLVTMLFLSHSYLFFIYILLALIASYTFGFSNYLFDKSKPLQTEQFKKELSADI